MNAPAYAIELEHVESSSPEKAMWSAALALLLDDARRYHRTGRDALNAITGTGRRALRDVIERGPMVRHLCNMADLDVDWLCERFAKSLQ